MPMRRSKSVFKCRMDSSELRSDIELLLVLLAPLRVKERSTFAHSVRVGRIATLLGEADELGLNENERRNLYAMGIAHDAGKTLILSRVLRKRSPLTPRERKHIERHVEFGVRMISSIKALRHLIEGIGHHHERYEGGGYPGGLKGDEISKAGRILAVADSYDAMRSRRTYKPPMTPDAVRAILSENSGQWDPAVVSVAMSRQAEIELIYKN